MALEEAAHVGPLYVPTVYGRQTHPKGREKCPSKGDLAEVSFPALSAHQYLLHSPFSLSAQIMPGHLHMSVPTEVDQKVWTQIILFTIF